MPQVHIEINVGYGRCIQCWTKNKDRNVQKRQLVPNGSVLHLCQDCYDRLMVELVTRRLHGKELP